MTHHDRIVYSIGPDTDAEVSATTARRAHDVRREMTAAALEGAPRSWMRSLRDRYAEPDADAVRASVARAAVVPETLNVPCRLHGAEAGEHCWNTPPSVCGARLSAAKAARAAAPDPGSLPDYVWRRPRRR